MQNVLKWVFGLLRATRDSVKSFGVSPPSSQSVVVDYYLNDPTTPELMARVVLPPKPGGPDFRIRGGGEPSPVPGTLGHRAAGCHITICDVMTYVQKMSRFPIKKWAATSVLAVDPEAGQQLNAFYDRSALRFFYAEDPATRKTVYCSEGTDIVAHEFGHAVLDAIRPDLWEVHSLEIWAFHEGFSDCIAMTNQMQHETVLDYAMRETGGDFRKSNIVSKIAAELGTALYNTSGGTEGTNKGYLRDAVNSFRYVPPATLPTQTKLEELSAEPHNFSRVWSGAFYDFMVYVYERLVAAGQSPKIALIAARDVAARYLIESTRIAPSVPRFYNAVGQAMLVVDRADGQPYHAEIQRAFGDRGILQRQVPFMMHRPVKLDELLGSIGTDAEVADLGPVLTIRSKNFQTMKGCAGREGINNPLYDFKLDVPADEYYELDKDGKVLNVISTEHAEVVESMHSCLNMLYLLDQVSPDPNTPFEIRDGKLVRTHFQCGGSGWFDNSTRKGAPEFGKGYKPENNCGCGGCGKSKEKPPVQTIKRGCVVRYVGGGTVSNRSGQVSRLRTC